MSQIEHIRTAKIHNYRNCPKMIEFNQNKTIWIVTLRGNIVPVDDDEESSSFVHGAGK